MSKKILLVNQSPGYLFIDIANSFQQKGWHCTIFTGKLERNLEHDLNPAVKRYRSISYNKNNTAYRLFTWIVFTIHLFIYFILKRNFKHIFLVTNPPTAPFLSLWCQRLNKIKFHILVFDLYPDILTHTGVLSRESKIYRYFHHLTQKTFGLADSVFTISPNMAKEIAKYGVPVSYIHVISNWPPNDIYEQVNNSNNETFIDAFGLREKKVVVYSGNLGKTHNFDILLSTAANLIKDDEIKFIIAGDGLQKNAIKERIHREKLTNVLLLPYQSVSSYYSMLKSADIAIVTQDGGLENFSVPSKTYTNLAAGLCLFAITSPHSDLATIIDQNEVGLHFTSSQNLEFQSSLAKILKTPLLLEQYKKNAFIASFKFTNKNADLYESVVTQHC